MNAVRKIVKNSGASLIAQVSTPLSSFVIVYFVARILGVSSLGVLASSLSLYYIFQAISSLGFNYLITKEVAQNKDQAGKYLVNAAIIGAIWSIFMAVIMSGVVHIITDNIKIVHSIYILSIALIPSTLTAVFLSICKAFEKIEFITISLVSGNLFKAITGLLILYYGYGIVAFVMVILCTNFLVCFLSFCFAYKYSFKQFMKFDFNFCKWIIRATPVFALIFILHTIRWNADTLILTNLIGEKEVGFYNAAFKLMNICKLGLSCYIFAIQPVIFRLFKSSETKFKMACDHSIRYLFIITLPIAFGVCLLSDKFILLIFKAEFLPASYVLSIIIWIQVLAGANLIFANALVASNNQKVNLKGIFISMVSNICLNLILIPKMGFIGAGIASVVSSVVLLGYQYFFIYNYLFKFDIFKELFKPTIAALIMAIVIVFIKDFNLFFVTFASALIYILALFATKPFSVDDKILLKQLFETE